VVPGKTVDSTMTSALRRMTRATGFRQHRQVGAGGGIDGCRHGNQDPGALAKGADIARELQFGTEQLAGVGRAGPVIAAA
jgi:hypothetical protein